MPEEIVISFSAETEELQKTIDLLEKLGQVDSKTAAEFRKATAEYQKRQEASKTLGDGLKRAGVESEVAAKKINTSLKSVGTGVADLRSNFLSIASSIGVAFGVAEVIRFGFESLKAFQQAELGAIKLKTAVGVNGGLQSDFDNLIEQSKELQQTTIFSDDDIQRIQTAALQFGLTADQVQALTPIITDFASATGQDLQSALQSVIQGINGNGRALRQYGVIVDDSKSKAEKFGDIQDQLNKKFEGQAKIVGETSAGAVAKLGNAFDELKEKVGQFLATEAGLTDFFKGLTRLFNTEFDLKIQFNKDLTAKARQEAVKQVEETAKLLAEKGEDVSRAGIIVQNQFQAQLKTLTEDLNKATTDAAKSEIAKRIFLAKAGFDAVLEINKKSADATLQYAKLTDAELQKLVGKNDVFAQDELDRRDAQRKKDQESQNKANAEKIKAQEELNKILASLNEQGAGDEFEARKIALQNNFNETKAQLEKLVEINPALATKAAEALKKALEVLNEETKQVSQDALKDAIETNEAILQDALDNIETFFQKQQELKEQVKDDPSTLVDEAAQAEADILAIKQQSIDAQIAQLGAFNAAGINTGRDFLAEIKRLEELRTALAQAEADKRKGIEEDLAKAQIDIILSTVGQIAEISSNVVQVLGNNSQARIEQIEIEKETQISAIDTELTVLEEKRKKEIISSKQFETEKKKLLAQRQAAEDNARKKENEEKRKADVANRAQKIFEITIATARNIAEVFPDPLLIALAAALGASQTAVVLSTPLPKYHTGQKAKMTQGEKMAIVREDEDIFAPEKSRAFRPTFQAIHEGKIKPIDLNRFVSLKLKGMTESRVQPIVIEKDIDYDKLADKLADAFAWKTRDNARILKSGFGKLAEAIISNPDPWKK